MIATYQRYNGSKVGFSVRQPVCTALKLAAGAMVPLGLYLVSNWRRKEEAEARRPEAVK